MMRRAVFSDTQRRGLEKRFLLQKYISKPDRKKLAEKLGLKDSQVSLNLIYACILILIILYVIWYTKYSKINVKINVRFQKNINYFIWPHKKHLKIIFLLNDLVKCWSH